MKDGRTYLTDSVPFSCCDPRVRRPCVHHSMLNSFQHTKYDSSNVTVYEVGCRRAMSNHYAATVTSFLKLLVACLVVQLALTVTFRYFQTSTGTAIEEEDMDVETRGYLWTVSTKKKPAATASGGKTTGKGDKSEAKKAGAEKKEKSERDKNRNNIRPNNNNLLSQDNYNNMAVDHASQHAEPGTKLLPRSDKSGARFMEQAPVTSMPSGATLSTSRQTSATYVSGSSRHTSGTRLTATSNVSDDSQQRTNETRSASRQQSHNSIATRSSASTSGLQSSAVGSSRSASTIRMVPNMSRNNNVNAAPSSLSASVADTRELHSASTSDLPVDVHCQQQQQKQQVVFDADAKRSSPPAVHSDRSNVEPIQRPEVPRPPTPIAIQEVHPAIMASVRLPRSVPLADYLVSPRSSLEQTGSTNTSNGNRQTYGHVTQHDRARGIGWSSAAMQAPLASVHHPVNAQSLTGAHAPSNYRIVPTVQHSSTVTPPPLPPRNRTASTTEDSPYVMMYPLRPPRNHPMTIKAHRK